MRWYYYLHINGDLLGKNPVAYNNDDFAENPFVKEFWLVDTENRADAWILVIEALALGARTERIKELANKWGLTAKDLKEFIFRCPEPTKLQKNGMDKFIKIILNEEPNIFWDNLKTES